MISLQSPNLVHFYTMFINVHFKYNKTQAPVAYSKTTYKNKI